jgi:hypothetical protein
MARTELIPNIRPKCGMLAGEKGDGGHGVAVPNRPNRLRTAEVVVLWLKCP